MIGVLTLPDITVVSTVSIAVLVLPGAAFVYASGGRPRPMVEWIAMSFGTAAAVSAVLSDVVHRLGGNVVWLFAILAALAFAAVPFGYLRPIKKPAYKGREWFGSVVVALAIVAALLASWEGLGLTRTADTFYHLQAPRSLLETASTRVTDPFFGNKALPPDATAGTWPSVVAPIALLSGVDTLPIFRVLAPILAFLLVCTFYSLARRFGAPEWAALLATIAFIVGGTALEFRNIIYPSRVAPLVWWVGLMWLIEWLEYGGRRRTVMAGVCFLAAATMHLSVAEAMLIALAITAVVSATWRGHHTLRLLAFALIVALIFVAVAWPSLEPLGLSKTLGIAGVDKEDVRSQVPVLKGPWGMAIVTGAGLPSLGAFALLFSAAIGLALWFRDSPVREAHRAPPVGMALGLPALLLNGVVTGALVERFWYHILRLTVVLKAGPYAAAAALLPDKPRWQSAARDLRATYIVLAALIAGLGASQGIQGLADRFVGPDPGEVAQARAALPEKRRAVERLAAQADTDPKARGLADAAAREVADLQALVDRSTFTFAYNHQNDRSVAHVGLVSKLAALGARPGAGVATPLDTLNYELAGLMGYRVVAVPGSHLPAAVSFGDGPKRLADQKALYDPKTDAVTRARILDEYGISAAVVPKQLGEAFALAGWRPVDHVGRSILLFVPARRD